MRRTPALLSLTSLAALALVASLAGCAPDPSSGGAGDNSKPTGAAADCTPSGAASDAVKVSGKFDTEPKVTIDAPVSVKSSQRTVVTKGDGDTVSTGDIVRVHLSFYSGQTGKLATTTGYTPDTLLQTPLDQTTLLPGLVKTINCSTIGSRVVGVVSADDGFGTNGYQDLGIQANESVVFVIDVVGVVASQASGTAHDLPSDFPKISFAKDGKPTVTIPKTDPPADLKIATVITGKGEKVGDGDSVTVQYQGVNWTSGKVFDESWGKGPATFTTDGVIAGFGKALVGQTVGSRVVVIIPADQGYGPQGGNESAGISATDTLVFTVDILATQPTS